jgi:hypothetical protein
MTKRAHKGTTQEVHVLTRPCIRKDKQVGRIRTIANNANETTVLHGEVGPH